MSLLKTATGTDEINEADIALLMEPSEERDTIGQILKQCKFNVHCFCDDKEYKNARSQTEFAATLAQGRTSPEIGRVIGLSSKYPDDKYCIVNGPDAVLDLLGLRIMIGYCLPKGYSKDDLIKTVRQMLV